MLRKLIQGGRVCRIPSTEGLEEGGVEIEGRGKVGVVEE